MIEEYPKVIAQGTYTDKQYTVYSGHQEEYGTDDGVPYVVWEHELSTDSEVAARLKYDELLAEGNTARIEKNYE